MNGLSLRASHISGFAEVSKEYNIDEHRATKREKIVVRKDSLFKIKNRQRKKSIEYCRIQLQEKQKRHRKLFKILQRST